MEVSGQRHAPAASPPGKEPRYPLYRRLGGPQSRSGRGGEEKNSQPLPGLEPPIIQPVAQRYTTELSRLQLFLQLLVKIKVGPHLQKLIICFRGSAFSVPQLGDDISLKKRCHTEFSSQT
jgi:hypothetical protein